MTAVATRHRFTTADFQRMGAAGIFPPDARIELVNGEIVDMSPIGPRHSGIVNLLNISLGGSLSKGWIVCVQNPVDLGSFDMPHPDICLARWRKDLYRFRHPVVADIGLLVEVAETSLEFDTGEKRQMYAAKGIPEYWVVDIPNRRLEVSTGPGPRGYESTVVLSPGDTASSTLVDGARIAVSDLFPAE